MLRKSTGAVLFGLAVTCVLLVGAQPPIQEPRQRAMKQMRDGNYREAYEVLHDLALNPKSTGDRVSGDLQNAIQCLNRLGRTDEVDAFREKVVRVHSTDWRLLQAAARSLLSGPHRGYIVAGKFHRGNKRGSGGQYADAFERDRTRALQLMQQALPLMQNEPDRMGCSTFHLTFAHNLLLGRFGNNESWRLQHLTDLTTLPDYETDGRYYPRWGYAPGNQGAPVDADGNPVFHHLPASYEKATSDGERWRWLLQEAMRIQPARAAEVKLILADFLRQQFGVQTMRNFGWPIPLTQGQDQEAGSTGPYSVHTLRDDETIARLRTGVKRFPLPDEFNFLKIYRQVSDGPKSRFAQQALRTLAEIYENRRQLPKAATYWRRIVEEYTSAKNSEAARHLEQIVGKWGRFDTGTVQAAGTGATVGFRFRNGKQVHFEAHRIRIEKLLDDVKTYLKSQPARIDGQKINIANIGYRLVQQNEKQYLGEQVAQWNVTLQPDPNHFDKHITVTTPLQQPGAYLLIARMADGNVSRIILWLSDTVIVKKPMNQRAYYFVADAVTGKPIPEANIEFFGYQVQRIDRNRYTVRTTQFAEFTDADGQVVPDPRDLKPQYQWLVLARTKSGRLAYLGFEGIWYGRYYDTEYNQSKVFVITDRPVYRPNQSVKFKFWIRQARYDKKDVSVFANRRVTIRLQNPKGETVLEKEFQTDAFGGFSGEYALPDDAPLGQYRLVILPQKSALGRSVGGGGTFRVEEYKKPEFEVTVETPDTPVKLGDKITATIQARYYFGAPVTHAKVRYKVYRTAQTKPWYPIDRWDWLYGPGYWWSGYDYDWYPGWSHWGCIRPIPIWWARRPDPPELVIDNETEIGSDGQVKIPIDTALAKQLHPDQDHSYRITAEVVDASRRTIVGEGSVLVARKPFKVFVWVDRGHYRVGETIHTTFKTQTLDRKPVRGKGVLRLLKVSYDEKGAPTEAEVQRWSLDTNNQGEAGLPLKASASGQYRLSYTLTDANKNTIEGGYVFIIRGDGFDGSEFRFNDLELVTDKRVYRPGERVKLLINTNRVGSTVALFLRPVNGIYRKPKILRLTGKSTVTEIMVAQKDMPNFFIEAVAISNGKVHSETREVIVPPEKRVVNVDVLPSSERYQPGAPAHVKVKLTDAHGKPFVGSVVLTLYDKSVEYIAGGSNIPDIRSFFWKWRRIHHPQTQSNLNRWFGNLLKSGETGMQNIGAFGYLEPVSKGMRPKRKTASLSSRSRAAVSLGAGAPSEAADAAAPMAALPMHATMFGEAKAVGAEKPGSAAMVQPTIRKEFADTAYWVADLTANANGLVDISLNMPENLTTWRIRAWTMGHGTSVGEGDAEVVTTKNLLVRLQAPRFFIETDEVVLSANVHNYLATKKLVRVLLELDGPTLMTMGSSTQTVSVAAGGEQRVDWRVKVAAPGEAIVRVKALTDEESDAMQMTFPVYVHGMLKTDSFTGVIRPDQNSAQIKLRVPAERRVADTRLEIRYSPTLAGAMVDALPYLVNYPYGCTEQTLNRFLPTVITQNILKRMNLNLRDIQNKRTNLNAQELGDDSKRAAQWKHYKRNPVFDEVEVNRMVKQGVKALTEMQLSDGGWGWFSGYGERSYPHTTAVVVHGLQLARDNRVALVPGVLERGITWLKNHQAEQVRRIKNAPSKTKPYKTHADNLDAFVFMVLVDADVVDEDMLNFLYRDRVGLSVYAKGMFGLALQKLGEADKLAMIIRNIDQFLVQDDENQTAYLKLPNGGYWWYWYGSETEANAYYLRLLASTDPKGEKASRLVKYLLNNRKHATYWNSTRDTAICIEALADYLTASGESEPNLIVEILVDDRKVKETHINADNLFTFDNRLVMEGDALSSGNHVIEIRKAGTGPVYFNAYLTNFTKEDQITRAGLEIKVNRKYYRLKKADKSVQVAGSRGQVVDQKVEKYERVELPNLAVLQSGDLVEIELEIDSKNDYEYLVFEDKKAAGFEPVDLRSGYSRNGLGAYMELRDERVVFFVRRLARGKHSISYRMRAEIPGRFSALPTKAQAMYAPELTGNSDEIKLIIEDRPQ